MNISTPVKFVLAALVVMALAEVSPRFVNAVLILILIGLILGHVGAFSTLARVIGTIK